VFVVLGEMGGEVTGVGVGVDMFSPNHSPDKKALRWPCPLFNGANGT
jgi:hypothetical protein